MRLFRFLMVAVTVMAAAFSVSSQTAPKKKVAVYMTGSDVDESYKKVIGSKLVSAITNTSEFAAVERTADFLAALSKEVDYSTSGEVRDDQIVRIGKKFGVKYVVVADVTSLFDELFIASRLINIENGLVEKAYETSGPAESLPQLIKLSQNVASGLLSGSSIGRNGVMATGAGGRNETFSVGGVTFEMVAVDGGSFMMGSYEGDNDERPVHSETVGSFMIGKTEVTQDLWTAVMGSNPSQFRGSNLPVESVSWYDVQNFISQLNTLTGRQFRLPTEAEWEYAAKGGKQSRGYKYSGSNDPFQVGWYDNIGGASTKPVAQKQPNELGIYDMSGNVWEWTQDIWCSNYSSPRNSTDRVYRGGSWNGMASFCRSALRNSSTPSNGNNNLGFRLAL